MRYAALFIIGVALPKAVLAQHEGAVHEMPGITVEGHVREGPVHEPREPPAGHDGGNQAGGASAAPATPASPKVTVTINGKDFSVSKIAADQVKEIIAEHKTVGSVGGIISALSAVLYAFGILAPESVPEGVVNAATLDINESLVRLSAPNTWNNAIRVKLENELHQRAGDAFRSGKGEEGRMWERIRDIIRQPGLYQGRVNVVSPGKVTISEDNWEKYREEIAYNYQLSDLDQLGLRYVFNFLLDRKHSTILKADFIEQLDPSKEKLGQISVRDQLILNLELIQLSEADKENLDVEMKRIISEPTATKELWTSLRTFLRKRAWKWHFVSGAERIKP